jgi:hypothetical protein
MTTKKAEDGGLEEATRGGLSREAACEPAR